MLLHTNLSGCVLRLWSDGDQPALVQNADDKSVWRNMTHMFPHPYTAADADSWIAFVSSGTTNVHLAIELHGELAGGIGVIPGEGISQRTAQFGYWLGRAHWGQGVATAAARAMAEHAFATTNLARLEAQVFEWNPASMWVLEKVGFEREGLLKCGAYKDGELIDSVMFAKTRDA